MASGDGFEEGSKCGWLRRMVLKRDAKMDGLEDDFKKGFKKDDSEE